jgi:hypothetical protein
VIEIDGDLYSISDNIFHYNAFCIEINAASAYTQIKDNLVIEYSTFTADAGTNTIIDDNDTAIQY